MIVKEQFVESFLEHYGVKGMQWGVRRDKIRAKKQNETRSQRSARRARNVRTALVVSGIVLYGAQYVRQYMNSQPKLSIRQNSNGTKFADIGNNWVKQTRAQGDILRQNMRTVRVAGPIGSTGIARLNGGIPMPRVGG